tara:strand:+ start:1820 stop:2596 length:777 start_codon:yes stop_codon:yes gene_type:complete
MKISSWNVNSVRARINNILEYLKKDSPDVLLLQEIKTEDKNFPINEFKKIKYNSYIFGQKSYNGVAILSKKEIKDINTSFFKDEKKHSRIISGIITMKNYKFLLINIYAPNGNPVDTDKYEYKLRWFDFFNNKIKLHLKKNSNIIVGGDFNIIPENIDVYDSKRYENDALFKLDVRKKFYELINLGLSDIYRYLKNDKQEFTFWDYMGSAWQKNYGMRIDHFLVSSNILDKVKSVNINKIPRSKTKPSDHTPIEIEII